MMITKILIRFGKIALLCGMAIQGAAAKQPGVAKPVNMGPTGVSVLITKGQPNYLKVHEVALGSPADGLLKPDDLIVGANGRIMDVSQNFHFFVSQAGPVQEMAKLIEDSQGKDGKLDLIVWPGGDSASRKTVTVNIEAIGRFSPTYPFNCPRSDLMLRKLRDHLAALSQTDEGFDKLPHAYSACILALMGTAEPRYDEVVDRFFKKYYDKRYDPTNGKSYGGAMVTWWNIHDSVLLGEYYLLTRDEKLRPVMESMSDCIENSIWPVDGGMPHMPYAAFERRREAGIKRKGYISMSGPSTIAMLGMSLFKEGGLPHAGPGYQRMHEAILASVNSSGSIGYYAKKWDHVVIELADEAASPKPNPRGVGFECGEGMKGAGEFAIVEGNKRNSDWVKNEAETNRVYTLAGKRRLVVRNMAPEDPRAPMAYNGEKCHDIGRTGAAALAHRIGNQNHESWGYVSDFMAMSCANSPSQLLAGHASAHMHVLWGSLGAATADPDKFRSYMDGIKWWFVMAQKHDGDFSRHYGRTDGMPWARNFPTGVAATILSLKDKRLRITGRAAAEGPDVSVEHPSGAEARPPRRIPPGTKEALDQALYKALLELNHEEKLVPMPLSLSKARAKVWLSKVGKEKQFEFRALQGEGTASFGWNELTAGDHAMMAALVARLRPRDPESQAMAGMFTELTGDVGMADVYYERAGAEMAGKIEVIFK